MRRAWGWWVAGTWLLLAACAPLRHAPDAPFPGAAEAQFDRGVAEWVARGETNLLTALMQTYPDTPWAARAWAVQAQGDRCRETAASLARATQQAQVMESEAAQLRPEVERLTVALAQAQADRDQAVAQRGLQKVELVRLQAEIARLRADREELKNLTIEMELKR